MVEFSILDCDPSSRNMIALSPYYIDFNIDRIVKEINAYWKEDVSALYRYFPSNEAGQAYRGAIYQDICREGMYDTLMAFREGMKERKKLIEDKTRTRFALQQAVMTLSEIKCYVDAVNLLHEKLSASSFSSEGMQTLAKLLSDYVTGDRYLQLRDKVTQLRDELGAIPIKLSYQDRLLTVSFEEVEGTYDAFLKGIGGEKKSKSPFGDSVEITYLEQEILEIVQKKYPQVFQSLDRFVKENAQYAEDFLLQLAEELAFYLSFYTFLQVMEKRGLYFTIAKQADNQCLQADDLYDLALACQLSREGKMPVANDMHLEANENFFVLTGPNQGGKTTFARSLGQLVFFSKLGLPVPAKRAQVPFYARILTHFSVEESVETGKGKLAEELTRLAPMMEDQTRQNAFVVINELFTTAANYDACIMGKRVLDHFIRQNCHGIYVTHLQDLSKEDPGVVSLRAMMNEAHQQNFKIVRSTDPALESSIILVEKHRLQYEQVKRRLKGETE